VVVIDVIDRVPTLGARAAGLRQEIVDARLRARARTRVSTAPIYPRLRAGPGRV